VQLGAHAGVFACGDSPAAVIGVPGDVWTVKENNMSDGDFITIFLCGDVMTGRGIDQILPYPSPAQIYEPYLQDARGYVKLAERASGAIPAPVDFAYPWGEALAVWEKVSPDLRIINLETSITRSEHHWKGKGINYRMNPANIPCLTAAGIDACSLANNHVIDWGYEGLLETLETLEAAGINKAGAGRNKDEAEKPAELVVPGKGRVLLFSFGLESSGIPDVWDAAPQRPGVNLLSGLSASSIAGIAAQVGGVKEAGDVVIASIHWGENWGFEIGEEERRFAHELIDTAGVDLVHGHSSHHVKGIEIYRGKLILYGCGDFLSDYEGIRGYEYFRAELGLMYFPQVDPATGKLSRLRLAPTRVSRLQIQRPSADDTKWLEATLNREGQRLGTAVRVMEDGMLELKWG
jgi:poly-gamma-glutamate capsule biosynthesis protein CapA/YwtB (metallophosphatase superfamily)